MQRTTEACDSQKRVEGGVHLSAAQAVTQVLSLYTATGEIACWKSAYDFQQHHQRHDLVVVSTRRMDGVGCSCCHVAATSSVDRAKWKGQGGNSDTRKSLSSWQNRETVMVLDLRALGSIPLISTT